MSASDRRRLADQPLDFTITAEERLADGFRPLDRLFVSHASLDGTQRFEGVRREVLRPVPVSYTHLTLPTICSV